MRSFKSFTASLALTVASAVLATAGAATAAEGHNVATARPVQHARTSTHVTVATFNMKHGSAMPHALADIIGWQEADNATAHRRIRNLAGYQTFPSKFSFSSFEDAISWNTANWRFDDGGYRKAVDGVARFTPNRYVVWVTLTNRHTGKTLTAIDTHFVNNAWALHTDLRKTRQHLWAQQQRVLVSVEARKAAKNPTIVVGDLNSDANLAHLATTLPAAGTKRGSRGYAYRTMVHSLPDVTKVKKATPGRGYLIDQIYVPRGAKQVHDHQLPTFGSDHHAQKAEFTL